MDPCCSTSLAITPPFARHPARLSPRPSTTQQGRAVPGRSTDG